MKLNFVYVGFVLALLLTVPSLRLDALNGQSNSHRQLAALTVSVDLPPKASGQRSAERDARPVASEVFLHHSELSQPGTEELEVLEVESENFNKPIMSPKIEKSLPARNPKPTRTMVQVVAKRGLQLRSQPWGEVVKSLADGTLLELIGDLDGDWAELRIDSTTGFAYSKYLVMVDEDGGDPYQFIELPGIRTISQNTQDPFDPEGTRGKFPSGYCGPASLQMVLDYFGVQRSRDYLALTDVGGGKIYREGIGSAYAPMVTMSKFLGFNDTEIVWSKTIDSIYERLLEGRPQIVSLRGPLRFKTGGRNRITGGHIVVVTGINSRGDLIIHDPAGAGTRTVMGEKDFLRVWRRFMVDVKMGQEGYVDQSGEIHAKVRSKRA